MLSFCVLFNHARLQLSLPSETTIENLKQKLKQLTVVPVGDQLVTYKNVELLDNATLAECGIKDAEQLKLLSRSRLNNQQPTARVEAYKRPTTQVGSVELTRKAHALGEGHIALAKYPDHAQALKLLNEIAADRVVIKVMNRRGYFITRLCELDPLEEEDVLGMNNRHEISLRLRRSSGFFLPINEIYDTLYHELAHMEIQAHNDEFYALVADIKEECEKIRFSSLGRSLNQLSFSNPSRYTPPSSSSSSSSPNKYFPLTTMNFFTQFQFDDMLRTILQNSSLVSEGLTDKEISMLVNLFDTLKLVSHYHSSKVTEEQIRLVIKLTRTWPTAKILPIVDLLRLVLTHPHASELVFVVDPSIVDFLLSHITRVIGEHHTLCFLCIRSIANIFKNKNNIRFIEEKEGAILEMLEGTSTHTNAQIISATTVVLSNMSIMRNSRLIKSHFIILRSLLMFLSPPFIPSVAGRPSKDKKEQKFELQLALSTLGTIMYSRPSYAEFSAELVALDDIVTKLQQANNTEIRECASEVKKYLHHSASVERVPSSSSSSSSSSENSSSTSSENSSSSSDTSASSSLRTCSSSGATTSHTTSSFSPSSSSYTHPYAAVAACLQTVRENVQERTAQRQAADAEYTSILQSLETLQVSTRSIVHELESLNSPPLSTISSSFSSLRSSIFSSKSVAIALAIGVAINGLISSR